MAKGKIWRRIFSASPKDGGKIRSVRLRVVGGNDAKPAPLEHDSQAAFFTWVNYHAQSDTRFKLIWATPNGGQRHPAVAAKLKKEGVKRGVPDITVAVASKGYHGLYIEMKRAGKNTTPEQEEMIALLQFNGFKTAVCYDAAEAIEVVTNYFDL